MMIKLLRCHIDATIGTLWMPLYTANKSEQQKLENLDLQWCLFTLKYNSIILSHYM